MVNAMRNFKRVFLLVSLFAATGAAAQVSVSIPAVVVDKSGQPVHGLQKSDFEVRSGKNVSFDSVEEVPPINLSGFAEPVPVFVLYDAVNMSVPTRAEVSQELLNYLRKAADDHLAVTVMEYTTSGILVIHDMSTDSRLFVAAMDRVLPKAGQPQAPASSGLGDDFLKAVDEESARIQQLKKPAGPNNPELQPYREPYLAKQLESLRVVGKMLQGSRKRKPLVWITGYFPYYVKDGDLTDQQTDSMGTLNSTYQAAIDSLNAARVTVFPVHVTTGNDDVNQPWARDGIAELAIWTGYSGKNLHSHSPDNFVSVMADLRKYFDSYYILTLTTQPTRKTNWIDNTVKVSKSDAEITAARGFFSTPQ
jgi:VWFA-related protein